MKNMEVYFPLLILMNMDMVIRTIIIMKELQVIKKAKSVLTVIPMIMTTSTAMNIPARSSLVIRA